MRIESLTKEFVKTNPNEAWEVIKFKRNLNILKNHDFTPFKYKSTYLNVKNLQKYLLPLIINYKIRENTTSNFVSYIGFSNTLYACKAFFVLSPELITKHFTKIKNIITNDIIPTCNNEITKQGVYRCLTDLRSIAIDYRLEQNQTKLN